MISYFFKVFQFFAAVCFNRHLLTFWILACLHTARNAPWKWMHLIFFVPTSCVSGADRKLIHLLQKTLFVCVYANSSLPVHQPSSFVTRITRVIESSRPSLFGMILFRSLLLTSNNIEHLYKMHYFMSQHRNPCRRQLPGHLCKQWILLRQVKWKNT